MVLNFLDSFFLQVSVKGKNYRRQLTAATREARRAAKMSLQVLPYLLDSPLLQAVQSPMISE